MASEGGAGGIGSWGASSGPGVAGEPGGDWSCRQPRQDSGHSCVPGAPAWPGTLSPSFVCGLRLRDSTSGSLSFVIGGKGVGCTGHRSMGDNSQRPPTPPNTGQGSSRCECPPRGWGPAWGWGGRPWAPRPSEWQHLPQNPSSNGHPKPRGGR